MSDSGNLPLDLHNYAVLPRSDHAGGILEDLLDHQASMLAEQGIDVTDDLEAEARLPAKANGARLDLSSGYDNSVISRDIDMEIPEKGYLLRSPSGDALLSPNGISDEDAFIVLFFDRRDQLFFLPAKGTSFVGAYNLPSEMSVHDLFYSGILFQLPDSERVAVIFHKR